MKKHIVMGLFFLKALFLCSQEPDYGVVVDTVWCQDDPDESYALYLPGTYTDDTVWAVIIALEPAARGALPAHKYQEIFEEFGYIFLCSNNSQNGPWEIIENAANALLKEAFNQYSIDEKRVYFSGFSGGSRSSSLMALKDQQIKGVIACGAGFPSDRQPEPGFDFDYIGLVGNKDANYYEMHQMSKKMQELKWDHQLTLFDGGHNWPPPELYEEGIIWMDIKAMEKNSKPVDTSLIRKFTTDQLTALDTTEYLYDKYLIYKKLYNYLKNLSDVTLFQSEIRKIEKSSVFHDVLEIKKEATRQELVHFDRISAEFLAIDVNYLSPVYPKKDLNWWNNYIEDLRNITLSEEHQEIRNMAYRVLDLIGNNTYSKYSNKMEKGQYSLALHYMNICQMINEEEKWPVFYIARTYAAMKNQDKTYESLVQLKKMGLESTGFIFKDPYLKPFMRKRKFKALFKEEDN